MLPDNMKEKSKPTHAMDEIQAAVRPFLKELGFRARWRAFNRLTSDGLTQVIEFQLGRFDPPGTNATGYRRDLYGKFTVNVGVYIPEVNKYTFPGDGERLFVHEYNCDVPRETWKFGTGAQGYLVGSRSTEGSRLRCGGIPPIGKRRIPLLGAIRESRCDPQAIDGTSHQFVHLQTEDYMRNHSSGSGTER